MQREGRGFEIAATALPVVVDVVHFFLFDLLNEPLRAMLRRPSEVSVLVLLGSYLAFAVSLFFLGRLRPEGPIATVVVTTRGDDGRERTTKTSWPELLFFYPSMGFGIVMIMAAVQATGMMETKGGLDAPWPAVAGVGMGIVFVVHLAASMTDIEPRYASNEPRYLTTLLPVLLISELMLNLSVALWHRFLGLDAGGKTAASPSVAGFLVAAPLFLLFFAIPRFTILRRSFTWPSLASALAFALYELWQLLKIAPLL